MTTRLFPLIPIATVAALAAGCGSSESPRQGAAGPDRSPPAQTASTERERERERDTRYADQDRDGKVTRDEAQADPYLAASFDRYDGDQNEALDRAEFARLEADAMGASTSEPSTANDRHQLRPRNEFPRPMQ